MWEHEEGQNLLRAMLDLGLCLHNTGSRPKDAIKVFQETIEMDPVDHLVSLCCVRMLERGWCILIDMA